MSELSTKKSILNSYTFKRKLIKKKLIKKETNLIGNVYQNVVVNPGPVVMNTLVIINGSGQDHIVMLLEVN